LQSFTQCVFDVIKGEGLVLIEIAPGTSVADVQAATGCNFVVSTEIREMLQAQ
jgi:3-oxoacid CoA-transferase